jgi:hypothetical protein
VLDIYRHSIPIGPLAALVRQVGARRPTTQENRELDTRAQAVAQTILSEINRAPRTPTTPIPYTSEQNLLGYASRAADFLILDLAMHFRRYNLRASIPAYASATSITNVRNIYQVARRLSGHVTGSFAEAMCPWVLRELGILTGPFYRLRGWVPPGAFGSVVADLIVTTVDGLSPCEVKHYSSEGTARRQGIKKAVTQVSACLPYLPSTTGYLFVTTAMPRTGSRYKIDVVTLTT